mmetsp:Transcript_16038/g.36847  ORF Transcript_16038/g.36847 Transcript_16038/m.36847 type:complete len:105 (+) Transcript_16038:203-517(+)
MVSTSEQQSASCCHHMARFVSFFCDNSRLPHNAHDFSLFFIDDDDTDIESRPKSRPGMLAVEGRAKYDGWKGCQDMTKQEAMDAYVALAQEQVGQPVTDVLEGK